ncbi:MAG: hypothetical protein K0S38_403 [Candidatus Paceibacter sp.]|jgi:Tfp pilus assembly protein PilO|nr:hypothetical protein [Candidatus Paceibacter sp.]
MKLFTPFILLAAAIGLLLLFVRPQYNEIQTIKAQIEEYDYAIGQAQMMVKQKDQLLTKRNSFKATDLERLNKFLPDSVDNIRWIIDINDRATQLGSKIDTIKVNEDTTKAASLGPDQSVYGNVTVSFNTSMSYENFQKFLIDMERSLRLIDVSSIKFKPGTDASKYDFAVTLRTYWLKPS